jgi:phage-related protein
MESGRPGYPRSEIITPKPVVWVGDSLVRLREFPREARREAGYQLERVQAGREPKDWKAMTSVGSGVRELRVRIEGAFRVMYVAKFAEAVYVLHAFQKKSRRTAPLDIQVARSRYRSLMSTRASQ